MDETFCNCFKQGEEEAAGCEEMVGAI
jgi:hypothetical protein